MLRWNATSVANGMVMGRTYVLQWSSDLAASAKVSIRCFQKSWLVDPLAFIVAVDIPNTGKYSFNSPRTFALAHSPDNDYYLRLEGGGAKAVETESFKIGVPKGRVTFDWTAAIVAGSKSYSINTELASVENGTVMTLAYTAQDVDASIQYTVLLGECRTCQCVRRDSDVSVSECGTFSSLLRREACSLDPAEPQYAIVSQPKNVQPTDQWQHTVQNLVQDTCYFFYFKASREEYSATTFSFKFTRRAIALRNPNIEDWPAGDTRDIAWTVLEDVSPTASLRLSLMERSKYFLVLDKDTQLSSSSLFKLRDGKAPFSLPASIDLKDNVYLQLSIESGEFAGTVVRSATFKIKPPAVVRPTIRLAGSTLSPRLWPTRSRQRLFFSTAAYNDPIAFPQPATATVTLEDDNPLGVEPFSLTLAPALALTDVGSFSVVVPVNAPSSASMRLKFAEPRQNLTIYSSYFVVAGTNVCKPSANGASATCSNLAGRRFLYSTDVYRVAIERIVIDTTPECGGSFSASFAASVVVERNASTATVQFDAIRTDEAQRGQLLVSNDLVIELAMTNVVYDAATGNAAMRVRLVDRKLDVTMDVVEYVALKVDVASLVCEMRTATGPMPSAEPVAPTQPPAPQKTQRCVADEAKCMVMCTPSVLRKCECDEQGQLIAFCSERDSVGLIATCFPSAKLALRCDEVCGVRSQAAQCACLSDGGSAVKCALEKCPIAASLDAECAAACTTYGVQQCGCTALGELQVYCNGQTQPVAPTTTTAPLGTDTAGAAHISPRSSAALALLAASHFLR